MPCRRSAAAVGWSRQAASRLSFIAFTLSHPPSPLPPHPSPQTPAEGLGLVPYDTSITHSLAMNASGAPCILACTNVTKYYSSSPIPSLASPALDWNKVYRTRNLKPPTGKSYGFALRVRVPRRDVRARAIVRSSHHHLRALPLRFCDIDVLTTFFGGDKRTFLLRR